MRTFDAPSLAGLRIIALAVNVPGPVAAARLTSLGADVIKVEPPEGDPLAGAAPVWYAALRAGCEVRRLDLATAADRAALEALLVTADLLLTSYRPSALARLDLAWPALRARFARLCHVAIIGHPAPDEERPGHDLTYLAPHGLLSPPALPRTLVADLCGAERAVSAALALLLARERGGVAGHAEVALAEVAADLAAPLAHGLTAPGGVLGGGLPGYGLYRARDGWVAVAALESRFRERLGAELGVELRAAALESAFAARGAEEWEAWGRARGLPIAAVRSTAGER